MRSLIYLQPMAFPTPKIHSIQITRLIGALGRRVEVLFVVGSLTVEPQRVAEAVRRIYGVELGPGVRLAVIPRKWFHTMTFPLGLRKVLARAPADADFYTRSFPIVEKLLRYRWLHRRRVFLESHKVAGYRHDDPIVNSPYAATRARIEQANPAPSRTRRVYANVDCVFFLHRHAMEAARRDQQLRDARHLWYGMQAGPADNSGPRSGFVYCGSILESKLFPVLLDALDRVGPDIRVCVYGAETSRIEELGRANAGRPCWERLDFRPRCDPAALPGELARFRHGIALMEGMKVIDYLENGITPIVPDLPSYRAVMDERHVRFFRPDDADSLARCLEESAGRTADPVAVQELLKTYSVDRRADAVIAKLEPGIGG